MKRVIKLLVAEDHQLVRQGFISLLKSFIYIKVIAEAADGKEVFEKLNKVDPEIILLDIEMPLMNGEEVAIILKKEFPLIKVIIISLHYDPFHVSRFYKIGVDAYLSKSCDIERVVKIINEVHERGSYIDEEILQLLIKGETHVKPEKSGLGQKSLNPIELACLKLLCRGRRDKEISAELKIPFNTFLSHKKNIKIKTGFSSPAQLAIYAVKQGIITLDI